MEKEELEIKGAELKIYIDNFKLSSEAVIKKAMEFEDLANRVYGLKDGAYWMQRCRRMEELLREVSCFCPAGHKYEIEKALELKH